MFNVCDDANAAPQTTRAYAMVRVGEGANAVLQLLLTAGLTATRLQLTVGLPERKMLMERCGVVCECCSAAVSDCGTDCGATVADCLPA